MPGDHAVIIGAGVGGLAAAIDLAVQGLAVTLLERAPGPGGKLRGVELDGRTLDAGPTVFTMRAVFDELFSDAGTSLAAHLTLRPLDTLARHAWDDGTRLDLHADPHRSAQAIGDFAGAAEARRFIEFCARSRQIYETLDASFMRAQRPDPIRLAIAVAPEGLGRLWGISPFTTMWQALGRHFHDPRLRQLFGRYATYCGSSPFAAPATLMLVAHAEQMGVWTIDGGMFRLADAMTRLAAARGVVIRYGTAVDEVLVARGRARGVRLSDGEEIAADAVICNADTAAVSSGLFGRNAAHATAQTPAKARSLSAVTWLLNAKTQVFPCIGTTCFSRAITPQNSTPLAGASNSLPTRPSMSALRIGTTGARDPAGPNAFFVWSTHRRPGTATLSMLRRSNNAPNEHSAGSHIAD